MKKTLFVPVLAMAAALSVSCSKEETEGVENGPVNGGEAALFAPQSVISASSAATKTALDGVNINWEEGDAITLFGKDGASVKYTLTEGAGATVGTFEAEGELPAQVQAYAVYPAVAEGVTLNEDKVAVSVAAEQTYNAAGFPAEYPMAAVTSDGQNFLFENLATVVSLSLKGDATVKTVSIEAVGGEKLAGAAAIDFAAEGAPVLKADAEASSIVTLSCGDGVQLTAEGVTFNFVVIPGIFSRGFKVTVSGDESTIMEKSTPAEPMTLNAGTIAKFSPMSATPMGWNITGSTMGWGTSWIDMIELRGLFYCQNVEMSADEEFKVLWANDWANQAFGSNNGFTLNKGVKLNNGEDNLKIAQDGVYDIYFDQMTKYLFIMEDGETPGFGLVGNVNGNNWSIESPVLMTMENGYFVAKNVTFSGDNAFKIVLDATYDNDYNLGGGKSFNVGDTVTAYKNGDNFVLSTSGTFDVWLDLGAMTVWVMAPGQTPADAIAE